MLGATYEKSYMITTKGQFMTHVNEVYLREDVSTGCAEFDEERSKTNILSISNDDISRKVIFFDSETLISQIDLIENCPLFKNIVLLQSSVKKVKQSKPKIYTKLRHFVELDSTKNVYIFPNEYCRDTAVLEKELQREKETHEIEKTLSWYKQKFTADWIEIIFISNNFKNNKAAKETGVTVLTVKEFAVENLQKFPELQNFIGVDQTVVDLDFNKYPEISTEFDSHLTEEEFLSMVRTGALLRGRIRISRNNIHEASLMSQFGFEVKVVGAEALNRAIHGDTVAVELFPEDQWLSAKHIDLKEDDMINENDDNQSEKTAETSNIQFRNLVEKIKTLELCPLGKVKGVIKRNLRNLAGQVKREIFTENGISYGDCQPVDPRYPNTILRLHNIEEMLDKKIIFSIDEWPQGSKMPFGHLVGVFGKADDLETESKVILFEHNVETREFSQAVIDCLPKEGKNFKITEEEVAKRQDLRGYPICSVDPPGCKDIDDALHSRMLPNGNIECGVHIADVTHFVRPDTAIDKEAAFRSTTVYLVDRRTDMLPSLLTENLCSLRGGIERLAFSCVWEMNPETAEIVKTKFHKSVIKSTNAFTYEQAQTLIDDHSKDNSTVRSLRGLMKMSKLLKTKRNKNGALTLASTQVKFKFDAETHNPTDVSYYTSFDTNSMVEEFMLLANISVAKKTLEHFPGKSILRHHNPPKAQMIKEFGNLMESIGYNFDYSSSKSLAESLDSINREDDSFFNRLVRIMTTRCMNEAAYICTADFDYPEYNHYGLATDVYTHFTSPIRRYADVLVHRLLAASLDIDSLPNTMCNKHNLTKLCDNMNMRHRNARFASRASSDYFSFLYFKDKKLKEEAVVCGIERNGVSVILPKYGFEGFIDYSEEDVEKNRKLIEKLGQKIVTQCVVGERELKMFSRIEVLLRMEMKHFRKQIIITLDEDE